MKIIRFGEERICKKCYREFIPEKPNQTKCSICLKYYLRSDFPSAYHTRERNVANKDFWAEHTEYANATGLAPWLADEDKIFLAEKEVPILVTSVIAGKNNYGDCWWIIAKIGVRHISLFDPSDVEDEDTVNRTITFGQRGDGGQRDVMVSKMAVHLKEGGNPINVCLTTFLTRSGNNAFGIAPARGVEHVSEEPEDSPEVQTIKRGQR